MMSTSAKVFQSLRYFVFHFTQVPHTHSVIFHFHFTQVPHTHSFTLDKYPTHILSHNHCHRMCVCQSKTANFHVYTHWLDISVVLCSQLPPHSCNHRDIPESSPRRYPTHILSHNHSHRMCICEHVVSQKSLYTPPPFLLGDFFLFVCHMRSLPHCQSTHLHHVHIHIENERTRSLKRIWNDFQFLLIWCVSLRWLGMGHGGNSVATPHDNKN